MPQSLPLVHAEDWQSQLRNVVTSAATLLDMLNLNAPDVGFSQEASREFPLKVPTAFVRRMQVGNPRDPLLRQVLANREELRGVPGYQRDPLGETGAANSAPGIIQKYRGRALLIVSGGCAVHCRYCFRRHFPYADNRNSRTQWSETLACIAADDSIEEVILSGGDPLVASDAQLAELVSGIGAMAHIRRLRIHSRLPIVLPDRVTGALLDAITHPQLQTVMVVHSNHGNELDDDVRRGFSVMHRRDITLLNQAVLLAGVNDDIRSLVDLSEGLFRGGALPYYLHLLDKVQGAAHFDVPESRARRLVGEVAARLPGYLVPRLVREIPGTPAKTILQPAY